MHEKTWRELRKMMPFLPIYGIKAHFGCCRLLDYRCAAALRAQVHANAWHQCGWPTANEDSPEER